MTDSLNSWSVKSKNNFVKGELSDDPLRGKLEFEFPFALGDFVLVLNDTKYDGGIPIDYSVDVDGFKEATFFYGFGFVGTGVVSAINFDFKFLGASLYSSCEVTADLAVGYKNIFYKTKIHDLTPKGNKVAPHPYQMIKIGHDSSPEKCLEIIQKLNKEKFDLLSGGNLKYSLNNESFIKVHQEELEMMYKDKGLWFPFA